MYAFHRHCKRSEAIQSRWLAASCVTIIAMTFAILGVSTSVYAREIAVGVASPCRGQLAESLNVADVVFEGAVEKVGLLEISSDKANNRNYNKINRWYLTQTYKVDRAWKGVSAGSEINTIYWFPVGEAQDDLPTLKAELPEFEKEARQRGSQIVILQRSKLYEGSYIMAGCDAFSYDITPENTKIVKEKFPQGAAQ